MLFLSLIFVGAFLLFQVQPLIAKLILPYYGGGGAVWTACLLFFQAFLLLGYFYAHKVTRLKSIKQQFTLHGSLLLTSVLVMPIGLSQKALNAQVLSSESPLIAILFQLTLAIGLPYFLLASTGSLVQRWLTFIDKKNLPYKLYSLSNFASVLALLSFPFLVEPLLDSSGQSLLWSLGYAVYVGLFFLVMRTLYLQLSAKGNTLSAVANEVQNAKEKLTAISKAKLLLWTGLSALGVVMLVATTNALTQNVPPVPFLWIMPLCLYLLTFIISFHSPKWYVRSYWFALFSLFAVLALCMFFIGSQFDIITQAIIYDLILFSACMICHGELARLKPDRHGLTLFYLTLSIGGFLGSAFVVFIAQNAFEQFLEFPIALLCIFLLFACSCAMQRCKHRGLFATSLSFFVIYSGLFLYVNQLYLKNDIHTERNFYGILSVKDVIADEVNERRLVDGTTSHGTQSLAANLRFTPLSYYRKESGIGLAFAQLRMNKRQNAQEAALNVGFIGLGAGTLAAYGKAGDHFTFYELNPAVISAARQYFTYLNDSSATIDISLGDARVSLTQTLDNNKRGDFDLLVVDAFSGDSIPQHLLTQEAISLYIEHLSSQGVIALHVSNSHLNLLPLMRGLAQHHNLAIRYFHTRAKQAHEHDTQWVWLSKDQALLNATTVKAYQSDWPDNEANKVLWTDAYSSLLSALK